MNNLNFSLGTKVITSIHAIEFDGYKPKFWRRRKFMPPSLRAYGAPRLRPTFKPAIYQVTQPRGGTMFIVHPAMLPAIRAAMGAFER